MGEMISHRSASLGEYGAAVETRLKELQDRRVIERVWEGDHTVWKPEPEEISNRLGWLRIAEAMKGALPEIEGLIESVRSEGYTHALLLGMGGSSLAPEVFREVFGVRDGYLDLAVLDSTAPGAVLRYEESLDLSRTLFVVSTKSGGTVETFSFFKYFFNRVAAEVGPENAGRHFIAITDPGSGLAKTADACGFRATFLNDPNIGGRYSALSHFGLVPAAVIGVDVARLLERATEMARQCRAPASQNPGALLGVVIGELARFRGRDKLTLLADPPFDSFGAWIEQLVAESTGKKGVGILPITGEPVGHLQDYSDDRVFVHLSSREDGPDDRISAAVEELATAGHPVVRLRLQDRYDLGAEVFRWEMAAVVAGHVLGINPFDQPNVESAKILAREMIETYRLKGELPEPEPSLQEGGISVYHAGNCDSLAGALADFLAGAQQGDYVALQAYMRPDPEATEALQRMRVLLRDRFQLATTVGYGPRFLHSTGQLHKGDGGNGLFIQFTTDPSRDLAIPDEPGSTGSFLTFGILERAQALGDGRALVEAGRRFIRFHLGEDVVGDIERLLEGLS